mgnify:CR=1 FL=1
MKKETFIRKMFLCCLLVLLVFAAGCKGEKAEEKVLESWDFNQGVGSFYSQAYTSGISNFTWEETGGVDGSGCVRIENTGENDARYVINMDVRPDTYYKISAWIKTQDVVQSSTAVGANISVLNTFEYGGGFVGDQDWTRVELYGYTAEDQKEIKVCLRLGFYSGICTGTAWFDNVEVQQLAQKPTGATVVSFKNSMSGGSSNYAEESMYWDAMKIGALLTVLFAAVFIVIYRYCDRGPLDVIVPSQRKKRNRQLLQWVLAIIGAGLLLRLILSVTAPQCNIDVNLFRYWGERCADDGIVNFYKNAEKYNLDYPPLYIYFLWFNTILARALGLTGTLGHTLLLKLPSMLADCVIAFLIYKICNPRMPRKWVLFLVAAWVFNPMVLLDSAAWGQVDSLQALPLFFMLYFIMKDRLVPASVCVAFAVILKPQGIFLIPILGFAWLRRLIWNREMSMGRKIGSLFGVLGSFAGTISLIALPFGIHRGTGFFRWIVELYIGTANGYKGATVNAYNFYYLLGENWTNDGTKWLFGLTFFQWGLLFIILICLLVGGLYLFGKMEAGTPFLLASTLVLAVTMFGPRMHERYFFPAIAFLLIAVVGTNNKILLWLYGGISGISFLSVLSVMMGLETGGVLKDAGASSTVYGWYYWAGDAIHRDLLTAGNLVLCILFVAVTVAYVTGNRYIRNKQYEIWTLEEEVYEEISLFE